MACCATNIVLPAPGRPAAPPAEELKFKISPVMCSARMVPQKRRSSMRSPKAAATTRWLRRSPVDVPAARKLALLVRPALIAGPGKVFVWSDWSAIEARIMPWLAASEGAEKVLDIFRANDRDPTRPDIYTIAASEILHKHPTEVTKAERAIGKVAVLALGFGGSVGALKAMALGYRISLDEAEARRTSPHGGRPIRGQNDVWRECNQFRSVFARLGSIAGGPPSVDADIAAVGPAQFLQNSERTPQRALVLADRPRPGS